MIFFKGIIAFCFVFVTIETPLSYSSHMKTITCVRVKLCTLAELLMLVWQDTCH